LSRTCDKSAVGRREIRRSATVFRGQVSTTFARIALRQLTWRRHPSTAFDKEDSTVRTLLVFLAGLTLVAVASTTGALAAPAPSHALSLKVSSYRVLYGHSMTVSGRLYGPHAAGRAVSVTAWPYGRSAPVKVATVRTASDGRFTYQASPRIRTTYWAKVGPTTSRKVVVGVAPALTMKVLSNGHVRVHVTAARAFYGRTIELQRRNASGTWTTVARKVVGPNATAVITRPLPSSTIRVAMSVNQAGAGYLGATTHALVFRPLALAMRPDTFKVLYGHRVTLSGRLANGGAGRHVLIVAKPYGQRAVRLATVTTKRGGRFSVSVLPRIMTEYQAQLGSIRPSSIVTVGVRPVMSVDRLASGKLRTRVVAAKSFRGRTVKLQRLVGSTWQTVARQPLKHGSTAVFAVSLPRSVVRVAMSVNQAGAGYLGTSSHPLVFRAV
jgi:hypothetical protein